MTAVVITFGLKGLNMYSIEQVNQLAISAGDKIMEIYDREYKIESKADNSPLTAADLASHYAIVAGLKLLSPNIPVLSEESSADELTDRISWTKYWLIDPLDGTKEFIKKNGEFTVNIALIEDGVAVLGVVYAPALGVLYYGDREGAFKVVNDIVTKVSVKAVPENDQVWGVVGSRSHQSPEFLDFVKNIKNHSIVSMGSSLKICLVAEGKADLYPRLGLTSEWDTAAAHAVVTAAGGLLVQYPELTPLIYNKNADTLLNPFFIVCAKVSDTWS